MRATSDDSGSSQPSAGRRNPRHDLGTYAQSRGAAFLAAAIVVVGQTWLAQSVGLRPVWPLPVVSAALLIGSVAVYRSDLEEPSLAMRWFAGGVVGSLAIANAVGLVFLVRGIFVGSGLSPGELLLAGVALWVVNVAVFALAYWEVDGDGPEDRAADNGKLPDLVFPQQQTDQQGLAPEGWAPTFLDYLYVSVTASTAFSPTDTMPYSRRAKLLLGLESTISFAIVAMLVARAVNIAKG